MTAVRVHRGCLRHSAGLADEGWDLLRGRWSPADAMWLFSRGQTVEQVASHELLWTLFALQNANQPGQLGEHLSSRCLINCTALETLVRGLWSLLR